MSKNNIELPPLPPMRIMTGEYRASDMHEYARAAIEADRQRRGEPVAWLYEDELPDNYPYAAMFPYSKVDGVRMFPVYAPQPADETTARIGAWLSAALCDPAVCQEMKGVIREWFKAGQPNVQPTVTATLQDAELIADDRNVDMALAFFAETPIKRQAIEVVQAVMQAVSKELWLNPMDGSQPAEPVVKETLTVPEGWQLVPKEPTQCMFDVFEHLCRDTNAGEPPFYLFERLYLEMLAAVPKFGEE